MKSIFLSVMLVCLAACGIGPQGSPGLPGISGSQGDVGPQGPVTVVAPTPTPSLDPTQDKINSLLQDENDYRLGLGQTMLSTGLSCTLYTFTSGDRIQATIAGHTTLTGLSQVATFLFKDVINQADSPSSDGMSVLPASLRGIYQNMYLLRCQGQIVVTQSAWYQFDLNSDDASVLYLDGSKLIDNDNNHGATLVSGSKYLRDGVHAFRLDYAQTGGNQALILKANNQLIEGRYYAH